MKIGILTHHTVINQGAIMQMYALRSWLESKGHDVFFLKYTKSFDFEPQEAGKYNISVKFIPFYVKEYLIKKGLGLFIFNVRKQLLYRKYIPSNFKFANYAVDKMDMVIVGSDEVFSLAVGCNMMMYGHGVNAKRIVSYAPSFGQTDLERIRKFNCAELIASGLKKFYALSVRDLPSAKIVEELTGRTPCIVCDPVLLYDFSKSTANIDSFHLKGKQYLLIYSMDRWMTEKHEIEAIQKYAKSRGLVTVSAGTYHKWCDMNIVCNPIEWLQVFRGASEVITDTFHGSVLSIITNKQTTYYIRDLNSKKISDLLTKFNIADRIADCLSEETIHRIMDQPTDFEEVNNILHDFRAESENYLNRCLSGDFDE